MWLFAAKRILLVIGSAVLDNQQRALTGNTFYTAVGCLICEICQEDTNKCQCPKTEAEAKQLVLKKNQPLKKIK